MDVFIDRLVEASRRDNPENVALREMHARKLAEYRKPRVRLRRAWAGLRGKP